jgi:NitT/TauT family transport system permease protein
MTSGARNVTEPQAETDSPRAGRRRRLPRILWVAGPPVAGAVVVVALWWLADVLLSIDPLLLPSPPDVVAAFLQMPGYLLEQTATTLVEILAGFALSVVAGTACGVGIAAWKVVERTIYPLLLGINAVPKLAIAPLLVIWLGFGQLPKIIMVLLGCFFPIVISTATGLMSTPAELVELARALDASRARTFRKVRFPAALREIFVGFKVAISLAVIGAVIGEFANAQGGLGFVIVQAGSSSDTALGFAAIGLLALLSVALFYLVVGVERLVIPWARQGAQSS